MSRKYLKELRCRNDWTYAGVAAPREKELSTRCEPCETGRRDGTPCDLSTCRCRCHREGTQAVEALADSSLDKARAVSRTRKIGKDKWLMTLNIKDLNIPSFEEEFGKDEK